MKRPREQPPTAARRGSQKPGGRPATPQREPRRAAAPVAPPIPLLPEIPEQLKLHPLTAALLTVAAFLDIAEAPLLDEAASRQVLERVGLYVQRLSDDEVEELAEDLERLSAHAEKAGWPEEAREFVQQFLSYCGFAVEGEGEGESEEDEAGESEAADEDE